MNDIGGIVLGWLTKLIIGISLLGLVCFDGISLVTATFSATDRAGVLASNAADDYHFSRDINATYARISTQAAEEGDEITPEDFTVMPNGRVQLVVQRVAPSLWMHRISPLKRFLHIRASGSGAPAS